jgi:hypothetical protein
VVGRTEDVVMIVTPIAFAKELLDRLGLPETENNVRALVAFQNQEGGHENGASFNPLNTMLSSALNPSFPYPSVNFVTKKPGPGIQAYGNWKEGIEATAMTMEQNNMRPIFDSLRASAPAATTVKVFGDSRWGWWDPKKGFAFKLPHPAADLIVRSDSVFRSYGSKMYSGAGAVFGSRAFKYGALGITGALVLGGLVFVGIGIKKKRDEERRRTIR